jgi:hypothetical protein
MFYVKSLLSVILVLILYGCTTVPPAIKPYPQAPQELMVSPAQLILLQNDATLVDVSETITKNYSLYHQLAEQLKALQEWTIKIREESINVNGRTESNKEEIR